MKATTIDREKRIFTEAEIETLLGQCVCPVCGWESAPQCDAAICRWDMDPEDWRTVENARETIEQWDLDGQPTVENGRQLPVLNFRAPAIFNPLPLEGVAA